MIMQIVCLLSLCVGYTNSYAMDFELIDFHPSSASSSSQRQTYVITDADRAALAQFPPVLSSLITLRPDGDYEQCFLTRARDFYAKKEDGSYVFYIIKQLCMYSKLSPQTKLLTLKTCQKIIQGEVVDLSNPLLTYDPNRERVQKTVLINTMPALLRDSCMQDIDGWNQGCLSSYMMLESFENISLASGDEIADQEEFVRYINYSCNEVINYRARAVSPHIHVQTVQQLHDVIFKRIQAPDTVYNEAEEVALQKTLIDRFPAPLDTICWQNRADIKFCYATENLLNFAYLLLNPDKLEVLIPALDQCAVDREKVNQKNNFYKNIKWRIKDLGIDEYKRLTWDFIRNFTTSQSLQVIPQTTNTQSQIVGTTTPVFVHGKSVGAEIDEQYKFLVDAITLASDTEKYKSLVSQLEAARTLLHVQARSDDGALIAKLRRPDFITAQFQEAMPTCCICLIQLAGYFNNQSVDAVVEKDLPCKHSVCKGCSLQWKESCPVCRAQIQ